MVDNFSLAVSHGLLILAAWQLLRRPDLDDEDTDTKRGRGWGFRRDA